MVMSLRALSKVYRTGVQLFKNGGKAAKNLTNLQGANGMRKVMFGGIGAAAAASLVACSNENDYYNDLDHDLKVSMNLEHRDIPTKTEYITKTDTIKVPEYITKTDTIKVPEYIHDTDTVWMDKIIEKIDTVYVDKIKTDTVYVKIPGETIEVPTNPEYKGEPEPVLDRITNILTPGEDTDGTTVLMKGMKMFEQHAIEGRFDGPNTSEKQQVYGLHVVDFEDDHNPTTYVKQMKIGRTTFNGQEAVSCDIIPPYKGKEKQKYLEMNAGDWNIFGAKRIILVPDEANNCVRKYVQGADGKYTQEGKLYRDEHGHVKEKNGLDNGQTWEQKIDNFQFLNSKKFLNELHPGSYGEK